MSIFGKIAAAIFGGRAEAAPATDPAASGAPVLPGSAPVPASPTAGAAGSPAASPAAAAATKASPAASAAPIAAMSAADVAAMLDRVADEKGDDLGDLDWRKSIVDLMKMVDIDSSLTSRKSLAKELGYTGDMSDSAKMNVWLHKQVMAKLAETGGVVPASYKD